MRLLLAILLVGSSLAAQEKPIYLLNSELFDGKDAIVSQSVDIIKQIDVSKRIFYKISVKTIEGTILESSLDLLDVETLEKSIARDKTTVTFLFNNAGLLSNALIISTYRISEIKISKK